LQVEHLEMDALCRGHEFDWVMCRRVLDDIERRAPVGGAIGMVDIGAGTQCCPELQPYLAARRDRVVLIHGPAPEVIQRNPCGPDRPLESYTEIEYTSRRPLYSIAAHVVDVTGRTEAESQKVFTECIGRQFGVITR
jgi:hypothetical protein